MKRMHNLSIFGIFVFLLVLIVLAPGRNEAGSSGGRKFYLTKHEVTAAQALNACANGYHMASLWEIFDPSNLKYNTKLGLTKDDSGSGPPTGDFGWARTGFRSEVFSVPGVANCAAWTTDSSLDHGTTLGLEIEWSIPSNDRIDPWATSAATCDSTVHVWCVQN